MQRYSWSNMSDMMEPDDRGAYYLDTEVNAALAARDAELAAWHSAFGTTQLTHALDRLEQTEKAVVRKDAELAEAKGRIAELESALRLALHVSTDDPVLITPQEKEIATLNAELAKVEVEVEWLRAVALECPDCEGSGAVTVPAHAPDCRGECRNCPVPERAPCEKCHGYGYTISENIIQELTALRKRYKEAVAVLRAIVNDLPSQRDWLNPDTENWARLVIAEDKK